MSSKSCNSRSAQPKYESTDQPLVISPKNLPLFERLRDEQPNRLYSTFNPVVASRHLAKLSPNQIFHPGFRENENPRKCILVP